MSTASDVTGSAITLAAKAEARAEISRASATADRLFRWLTGAMAWLILIVLGGAALAMFWGGRLAFQTFGFKFIYSADWDPVTKHFGALCRSTALSSVRSSPSCSPCR